MGGAINLFPQYAFIELAGKNLLLYNFSDTLLLKSLRKTEYASVHKFIYRSD